MTLAKPVRAGDYRRALVGERWDSLISDAPFGARTHEGARTCAKHGQHKITDYGHWTAKDVARFVAWAVPRTRRWCFVLTSHDLIPAWEAAYDERGWYRFTPVPIVVKGMGVRRQGDGPASWTLYAVPARSKHARSMKNYASHGTALWRALPGAYITTRGESGDGQGRGKSLDLMAEVVRDYSNRGDTVCDPLAGLGRTLEAAAMMGRRVVGAEIDRTVAAKANAAIVRALRGVPDE